MWTYVVWSEGTVEMEEEDMRSGPETNHKNKSLLLRISVTGPRMLHVVWYGVNFF